MAKEKITEAKDSIEGEDFTSGFQTLYELETWYSGLPEQKEIKSLIKELTASHKGNKEAKEAIKLAKENQDAFELYQKAQLSFLKGKDAQGQKTMKKIQNKFPESTYAFKEPELIKIKIPLVKPTGSPSPTSPGGSGG